MKELFSFAGWSIYSTGCIVGRQQGIAVVLNRIMGTAVNAAYGIAFNIASYTSFLSTALVNAIVPQIVKSEGAGNRERALWLSNITCKFMFFLLSAICIPCLFEIDNILDWWLEEVPEYASLFCRMVFVASMVDALTVGLANINQAIGKIGPYSLIVNTPKLLALPAALVCLKLSLPLQAVAITYVAVELLCACLRLPFIHRTAGLDVGRFMKEVIAMEVLPVLCCIGACVVFTRLTSFPYRFVVTFVVAMMVYALAIYLLGLLPKERIIIHNIGREFLNRFKAR
jgi:Na+-driven multidrug efflux pump